MSKNCLRRESPGARRSSPKWAARVTVNETRKKREVIVTPDVGEAKAYTIPYGSRLKVADGDVIEAGDELTEGSINPNDILKIKGIKGVQTYLLQGSTAGLPYAGRGNFG